MLPLAMEQDIVEKLARLAEGNGNYAPFSVDLEKQIVMAPNGESYAFETEPQRRQQLLKGLDDIGVTLMKISNIANFRKADEKARPWIYI